MRAPIVLSLLVAATLGGCALPQDQVGPGMSWGLEDPTPDRARLVLGAPETDDVAMILSCHPGWGAVDVTVVDRQTDGAVVELRSGEVLGRYTGAGHDDEESAGAVDIDLKLSAADPVLVSFANTGQLEIVFTGRSVRLPNGFAQAHDFLRVCRLPADRR